MIYSNYRYIYPPRPERKIPKSELKEYDKGGFFDGEFLAEPKFNGSCGPLFFSKDEFIPMNRHKDKLTTFKLQPSEFRNLFPNEKWNVIVGEYMNKSKKDDSNKVFNHKFVIFDILVINGDYMLGKTFEQRWNMLYDMFKDQIIGENEYSYQITENIWLVKVFYTDFESIWEKLTKIDMIEGLVLKKRNFGLEPGISEKNNTAQVKIRKPTLNYQY